MEILKNYLDSMFMNLPQTEEVMKAKTELFSMMEDKYNELKAEGKTENEAIGTVIAEFGNLEELAEELGISGWVGKRNQQQEFTANKTDWEKKAVRTVSFQECREYIDFMKQSAKKIAGGVALCICSPVLLIVFSAVQEKSAFLTEEAAAAAGLTVLLCMVAAAVAVFIMEGMKFSQYEVYKKEVFSLEQAAQDYITNERRQRTGSISTRIVVGVVLCILGVVPLIIAGGFYEENEVVVCGTVGLLLLVVAAAVALFITAGMEDGSYKVMLQEADYEMAHKKANTVVDKIASVYWPLVVCIYLAWSFLAGAWGISWVIWPIAGVLFGAIAAVCSAISSEHA